VGADFMQDKKKSSKDKKCQASCEILKLKRREESLVLAMLHDLRNSLSPIMGYAQCMKTEVKDREAEIYKYGVCGIVRMCFKMMNVIGNLINILAIERNDIVIHRERFYLTDIIKGCVIKLETELVPPLKVRLGTEPAKDRSYPIYSDKKLVEEIIYKLCCYLMEFSEGNIPIDIDVKEKDNVTILSFGIKGLQIPKNYLEKISDNWTNILDFGMEERSCDPGFYLAFSALAIHLLGGKLELNYGANGMQNVELIMPRG